MDHSIKAGELFLSGANCSQAVILAFNDLTGLDDRTALRISSAFGGGIGRKSHLIRALALEGLEFLGICTDEDKNRQAEGGDDISRDGSPVRIFVVDTNEEIIVARKAMSLLNKR